VSGVDFSSLELAVGHSTDTDGATGCTVVRRTEGYFRAGVAVVGRATATRELLLASPAHVTDRIDAILLSGGSSYGLDAAAGVMRWMEEHGRGFPMSGGVVPLVPAAAIFDLSPLGRFDARPTVDMAYAACDTARPSDILEGSVGAGAGATVGKVAGMDRSMKGGIGCWVERIDDLAVGAVTVVNAVGDVRDAHRQILAGARTADGAFVDSARLLSRGTAWSRGSTHAANTTLAVVATNVTMSRVEVEQLARASTAALYHRITPVGTSFDGDIVFALCPHDGLTASPGQIEALAVSVLEMAVERAVRLAVGRDGIPGLGDPK
jgi:L-aminopeptidase/D-esterase-like protein